MGNSFHSYLAGGDSGFVAILSTLGGSALHPPLRWAAESVPLGTHLRGHAAPQSGRPAHGLQGVGGSSPPVATISKGCIPQTWFTSDTGHMVYTTAGKNGLGAGSTRPQSSSKNPRSKSIKLTSQILSATSRTPTTWPLNTILRLILR